MGCHHIEAGSETGILGSDRICREMDFNELKQLVAQGEGQQVEFKVGFNEEPQAMEALGAFLNADGGHVLLGIRDDKTLVGVTVGSNTKEELAARIERAIDPIPYPAIDAIEVDGKVILSMRVEARRLGTVYFVRGKPYVRVGATTRLLTASEVKARHVGGASPPALPDDWSREENGPQFHLNPGSSNGKGAPNRLTMTFSITGADVRPRFRWIGEGVTADWLALTAENPPSARKYSVQGGTPFNPPADSGNVGFEVEFPWRNAECLALWEFPFHLEPQNTWVNLVLDTTIRHLTPVRCWRTLDT